jgi:hypothetical protein
MRYAQIRPIYFRGGGLFRTIAIYIGFGLGFFTPLAMADEPQRSCPESSCPESWTPAESAILQTFLAERPTLRTSTSPRWVAADTENNLWVETLREDSRQRLGRKILDLEVQIRLGRNRRLEYVRTALAQLQSGFLDAGVDLLPTASVLKKYQELLRQLPRATEKQPPWARAAAEQTTRQFYSQTFQRILDRQREALRGASVHMPVGLPRVLPREQWPREAVQFYEKQLSKLEEKRKSVPEAPALPSGVYQLWHASSVQHFSRQVQILNQLAETGPAALGASNVDVSSAFNLFLMERKQHLERLLESFEMQYRAYDGQKAALVFLQSTQAEHQRNLKQLELLLYGSENSRLNGVLMGRVNDAKLEWLHDLHWAKYGIQEPAPFGRFYHTHADRILNPQVYWQRVRALVKDYFKKAVMGATLSTAAAIGLGGGAFLAKSAIQALASGLEPEYVRSSEVQSMSSLSGTVSSTKPENEMEVLFRTEGTFPRGYLELPVEEDLADGLQLQEGLPAEPPTADATLTTQVPFAPLHGRYVGIPKVPGMELIRVKVRRDGITQRIGEDFNLLGTHKGFQFIRFSDGDNFPWFYHSQVDFELGYAVEASKSDTNTEIEPTAAKAAQGSTPSSALSNTLSKTLSSTLSNTPTPPRVSPSELRLIAQRLEQAGLTGALTQRFAELANELAVDLEDLSNAMGEYSLYSQHAAKVRRPGWSSNYVYRFSEFIDEEFAGDCDVSATLLECMTADIADAKSGWEFQVRPSIHQNETNLLRVRDRHGRLYGWKAGVVNPLILDPTALHPDTRAVTESPEPVAPGNSAPRGQSALVALHRFRFPGDPLLQEGEPGVLPDPDLADPVVARAIRRHHRRQLLLAMVQGELSNRQQSNAERAAWLVELKAALSDLQNQVSEAGLRESPRQGPHQLAMQYAQLLMQYLHTGAPDGLEAAFSSIEIKSEPGDWQDAFAKLEARVRQQIQAVRGDSVGRRRFARELSVADATLSLVALMASHSWTAFETVDPNQVRRYCHESLLHSHTDSL